MADRPRVLLSLAQVARRAGVSPSAVSNWRARNVDFPELRLVDGAELVNADEIAEWLDGRRIPKNARREDEADGVTYGQRFAARSATAPAADDLPAKEDLRPLWAVAERLRGVVDAGGFLEIVLGALCLRLWEPAQWDRFTSGPSGIDVTGLTVQSGPASGLRPFERLPHAPRGRDLAELGGAVDRLDLSGAATDPSRRCRLLVEVLEQFGGRSKTGDHLTPPSVVDLMVGIADPRPDERVHDLFSRSGEFLAGVLAHVLHSNGEPADIAMSGWTPNERSGWLTRLGAAFLGVRMDIAVTAEPWAPSAEAPVAVVLGNPPYNVGVRDVDPTVWRYGQPSPRSDLAWLQLAARRIGAVGRAVVLTANGATFSSRASDRAVRAAMVDDGIVEAVIALPNHLFTSTGIPVTVWVLGPPRPPDRAGVLFIDATALGELRNRHRSLSADEVGRIVDRCHSLREGRETGRSRAVAAAVATPAEIAGADYALNPRQRVPLSTTVEPFSTRSARFSTAAVELDAAQRVIARAELRSGSAEWTAEPMRVERRVLLGDMCDVVVGRPAVDAVDPDPGVPVLIPRNIRHSMLAPDPFLRGAAPQTHPRLSAGDVVGTRVGDVGRFALVGEEHAGWLLGPGCLGLRMTGEIDPRYLTFVLRSSAVREWVDRHSDGSAIRHLNAATLRALPLDLPPIEDQTRVGSHLAAVADASERYFRAADRAADLVDAGADLLP